MSRRLLTSALLEQPPPKGRREEIRDTQSPLILRVTEQGGRCFVVRARIRGQKQPIRVAHAATVHASALDEARAWAMATVAACRRGEDPRAIKTAQKETSAKLERNKFRAVVANFLKRHAAKNRGCAESKRVLELYALPRWGEWQIADIRRADVAALLDDIEVRAFKGPGGKLYGGPVMADRVLAQLRKVMNWHAARDSDYVSPIVKGMSRTKPRERARERILTDDELRALWAALDDRDKTVAARLPDSEPPMPDVFASLVRGLLLTAQRRVEVSQMARTEISDGGAWEIPSERNKTSKPNSVHLSGSALAVLARQGQVDGSELLFTTNGKTPFSGFSKSKRALDVAMLAKLTQTAAERGDKAALARCGELEALFALAHRGDAAAKAKLRTKWWILHDLRRTAKTLMARAGVRPDISERVLGHVISGVEGVYDRHDYAEEKRAALEKLASIVEQIVGAADANVVPLVRAARA